MSLVIDGVHFQLPQSGIARIWRAVLPLLASKLDMPIVLLDRGGIAQEIAGVEVVPFPSYKSKFNPHDSELLERICRHYDAKAFFSTCYTTPLQTPSMVVVYDMIAERFGLDLTARDLREKEIAIAHARRHICISDSTRRDLLEYYPELDPQKTTFVHCGVDRSIFKPSEQHAIAEFRRSLDLTAPYFLLMGSRERSSSHKNAALFFDALKTVRKVDFGVLCVGGEASIESSVLNRTGHKVIQVDRLDDEGLALAYGGAAALVYPSLYEGFGLPVPEAMSCGCPVITTSRGSLGEVSGDAALTIGGDSVSEMAEALAAVCDPAVRERLIAAGARHAAKFLWEPFADEVANTVRIIAADSRAGAYKAFYEKWTELRALQGEVDVLS